MARDIDHKILQTHERQAKTHAVAGSLDIVLTTAKNLPGHWDGLEDDQRHMIEEEAEARVRAVIDELVSALGSGGFTRCPAVLESFSQGKTNVAKLIIPDTADRDSRHALGDWKGEAVTIVLVEKSTFDKPKEKDADDTQGDLLDGVANTMAAQDSDGDGEDSDDRGLD